MSSSQRIAANRANAVQSTGPKTAAGKAASRANAVRHGALATVVTIDAEERAVFEDLVTALDADLRPVGPLEAALVEKIALALWRNRRLARAERGSLALQLRPSRIVRFASSEVLGEYGPEATASDLEPIDPDTLAWNKAVLEEYPGALHASVGELAEAAPTIYRQLVVDAETGDLAGIRAYIAQEYAGGLSEYVLGLVAWSRRHVASAERQPELIAMAETMRDRAQLLPIQTTQLFARYQTILDGQLYKAMRALRALQEMRFEALEARALESLDPAEDEITAA